MSDPTTLHQLKWLEVQKSDSKNGVRRAICKPSLVRCAGLARGNMAALFRGNSKRKDSEENKETDTVP